MIMARGAPMPADLAVTVAVATRAAKLPQASANPFSLFLADNGRASAAYGAHTTGHVIQILRMLVCVIFK